MKLLQLRGLFRVIKMILNNIIHDVAVVHSGERSIRILIYIRSGSLFNPNEIICIFTLCIFCRLYTQNHNDKNKKMQK